ncbi:MAG: T9SS C-terminal target domain-containing protein [Balneolaceae bacterium]|nr:MAG: T9SS C-terminal target domain-containing protein [Balneolaceae bacterium]
MIKRYTTLSQGSYTSKSFLKKPGQALLALIFLAVFCNDTAYSQAKAINIKGELINLADAVGESVAEVDSLALVAMYHSLRGTTWRDNSGWLQDQVIFWMGVDEIEEIDLGNGESEWRVTRFSTSSWDTENMTECGYLPPEVVDMEYLEYFQIENQWLCGELNRELLSLPNLYYYHFRKNYLTGEIPWDAMGDSPSLEFFSITENALRGPVMTADVVRAERVWGIELDRNFHLDGAYPPELVQMQSLRRFYANKMPNVSGPMPDFSQVSTIERVEIKYTNFDPGPFPEWVRDVGGFDGIDRLALVENNIIGPVPDWIVELSNLTELHIGGRDMEMDMADFPDLSLMPSLSRLNIFGGNFHGELPAWFADMSLDRLWIKYTNIGGTLDILAEMPSLGVLKVNYNQFEGGIPAGFRELNGLRFLSLDYNNLEIGEIPDFIGNNMAGLNMLYLAGSGVTGEIPSSLSNLQSLSRLRLQDNPGLGGAIPGWIWDLDMEAFDISNTSIDVNGEFPSQIKNWTSLRKLGLGGLGINGEIPQWLGDMEFRKTKTARTLHPYLSLANNNLTGPIPENMGNFYTLDSLNLSNNQLVGGIEMLASIGRADPNNTDVALLEALVLSGNPGLTGSIPTAFMDNHKTRVFHFEGTDLCMPAGFDTYLDDIVEFGGFSAWYNRRMPYTSVTDYSAMNFCSDVSADDLSDTAYRFMLYSNYPNPFNPTTTIRYEIAEGDNVTLRIYNVIGQRVATLVNEHRNAGLHEVHFDASNIASGQYIYRLESGNRVQTETMTLIK